MSSSQKSSTRKLKLVILNCPYDILHSSDTRVPALAPDRALSRDKKTSRMDSNSVT